jgi:hypothetical protein
VTDTMAEPKRTRTKQDAVPSTPATGKSAKVPPTPVSIRQSDELLHQVNDFRRDLEFPVSLSAVIEKALKEFLAKKKAD